MQKRWKQGLEGMLNDEYEKDHWLVSYDKTKCWTKRITSSAANIGGKRRWTDSYWAHSVDNGQQCEASVDEYETVWPLFQVQNGIRGRRHRRKGTSSLELVHDLLSIRGHFTLDQRGSAVLDVQEVHTLAICLPHK